MKRNDGNRIVLRQIKRRYDKSFTNALGQVPLEQLNLIFIGKAICAKAVEHNTVRLRLPQSRITGPL